MGTQMRIMQNNSGLTLTFDASENLLNFTGGQLLDKHGHVIISDVCLKRSSETLLPSVVHMCCFWIHSSCRTVLKSRNEE